MSKKILLINPSPITVKNKYHRQLFSIIKEFKLQIDQINYKSTRFSNYLKKNSQKYSHIIISGSSSLNDPSIDQMKSIKKNYSWATSIGKPVLGVCVGHQILGYLYGSEILHNAEKEQGDILIKKVKEAKILLGLSKEFKLFQEHRDSISLPIDFILFASSDSCENQVMKHKKKNIFGIQGHPEFSGNNGKKIIGNFLNT